MSRPIREEGPVSWSVVFACMLVAAFAVGAIARDVRPAAGALGAGLLMSWLNRHQRPTLPGVLAAATGLAALYALGWLLRIGR